MKQLILLFLFGASIPACAQHNYDNLNSNNIDDKKIDVLLDKIHSGQATADDKKDLYNIAVTLQNNGQDFDQKNQQYKKALASTDKAIALFTELKDTLDIANNRKYKGYLLGKMGKMKDAKTEIKAAVDLYRYKNMNAEVAVSQFDLARIFEFENKTDSAIYYADVAGSFWRMKQVDLRVLIINNMLVSLFLKANLPEKAKTVQQESTLLVVKPDIQWQAIIDFYFTSMLLFRTINDIGIAGDYQRLYLSKIEALRNSGIIAKSYYEHDRE